MNKSEVIEYLDAIIVVTDIPGLKHDSKKLRDKLLEQGEDLSTKYLSKFNVLKSMYLREQREWEERNGLGHRVSKYTD